MVIEIADLNRPRIGSKKNPPFLPLNCVNEIEVKMEVWGISFCVEFMYVLF